MIISTKLRCEALQMPSARCAAELAAHWSISGNIVRCFQVGAATASQHPVINK